MKNLSILPLLFLATFAPANTPKTNPPISPYLSIPAPPPPAPDFTVTTSDGQVKKLYQDYVNQQKVLVVEAFFTTCPPCATHAPFFQTLYTNMQAAHPGQVEFMLLSTLFSDTNVKVAQYKVNKGMTMPGVGNDGGSIAALQPYLSGQWGAFEGTPTFFIIAPGTGEVFFDIRGNSPAQTMTLLQQKIETLLAVDCTLKNPFDNPLDDVHITVDAPAFDTTVIASSSYKLSNIVSLQNTSYTLKARKTGDPLDGLTTYDLVLISKHILGTEPLLCSWQQIAADVNCTGSITTFDIVTARKVILGIVDTLPCGAWRFLPDSALVANRACQNFEGVKLGDLNRGPCNDSLAALSESRSLPQTVFFHERDFQPGETTRVVFFFQEKTVLDGLQFSFGFDPAFLKINAVESETLLDFDTESYRLHDGQLAVSWLYPGGQNLPAKSPFLTLDLSAPQGGKLSELLHFSASGLAPEVYGADRQIRPLQLAPVLPFSDFSISPNPVHDHFVIQANTMHDGEFLIQMMDVQGKIVFEKKYPATKGWNSWGIETADNSSGVYFLKANGEAVGKLIKW